MMSRCTKKKKAESSESETRHRERRERASDQRHYHLRVLTLVASRAAVCGAIIDCILPQQMGIALQFVSAPRSSLKKLSPRAMCAM